MFKKIVSFYLSLFLALTGFIPPQVSWAQEKESYTLAVLDLNPQGISLSEAAFLSEHLHTQVTRVVTSESFKKTTHIDYTIVERSQMDKIFEQFEIQNTGCTDVSCAVEFGKMLSAERIIIGSVGLVGKTYSIASRIVDIKTSTTISVADYTYTGPIDDLLTIGIQSVVNELLYGRKQKKSKKLYIIAGITAVAIGAAIAVLSSSDKAGEEDSGSIYIKLPVPED